MQLVIIAGGKGTRLRQVTADLPKPMVDIGGKPLLEHQLLLAREQGIRDVLLLTGYGSEKIEQHFGDGSRWALNIKYHLEDVPLGTAGAVLNAFDKLEKEFLLMYGDTILNVDLNRMVAAHSPTFAATLFVHPNDHPQDSDLVELGKNDAVIALHPYPHPPDLALGNLVNAALYVFTKRHLESVHETWLKNPEALDICKHLFPKLLASEVPLQGYRSREYIKDAGTPERLAKVRSQYDSGRISQGSLRTSVPAIFLDRDGTLNFDYGWIDSPEKMELLPGAAEAVRAINSSGHLAVVITNQPVIARGACTEDDLLEIHNRLEWLLGRQGAYIDALYYCPHHPDRGFPGERSELKISCQCRKPATGLFERAIAELRIDASRSWMIGDSEVDFLAASRMGIPSVGVLRNQAETPNQGAAQQRAWQRGVAQAVEKILSISSPNTQ